MHANASLAERQSDPSGTDAELERGAFTRQPGEELHGRLEYTGIEHVGRVRVVPVGAVVEVALGHWRTMAVALRSHHLFTPAIYAGSRTSLTTDFIVPVMKFGMSADVF